MCRGLWDVLPIQSTNAGLDGYGVFETSILFLDLRDVKGLDGWIAV